MDENLGEVLSRCRFCGAGNTQCSLGSISAHPGVVALQLTALAIALNLADGKRQSTMTPSRLTLSILLCSQFAAAQSTGPAGLGSSSLQCPCICGWLVGIYLTPQNLS